MATLLCAPPPPQHQDQDQDHVQQQTAWLNSLVLGLADLGVAGLQMLGTDLTLEGLGEQLEIGPFPGDLDLVVQVSGSTMCFSRGWPLTPAAAAAINQAAASLPGARWGVIASELGYDHTAPMHGQYAYIFMMSAAEVEAAGGGQRTPTQPEPAR